MTRISSLAANTLLLNQIFRTQQSLFEQETKVTTQQNSQDYTGVATESQRLVTLENTRDSLQRFNQTNQVEDTRLEVTNAALDGISETLIDFRSALNTFETGAIKDETRVKTIQDDAFRTLKSLEDLLNIDIDGRFQFAGARVTTEPVDFGLTTVSAFQTKYDGAKVTYPTTRDAHLSDLSLDQNSAGRTDWLVFDDNDAGVSTVTASTAQFGNVKAGSTITITGTNNNNGTYTVASVNSPTNTIVTIVSEEFETQAASAGTVTFRDPSDINVTVSASSGTLDFTGNVGSTADTVVYTDEALDGLTVGTAFTVSGTANAANNKTFTVSAIDTTTNTISITPQRFTDEGAAGSEFFDKTAAGAAISFADVGSADTITSTVAGFFTNLKAGMQVTVTGATDAGNNATHTIASVSTDGTTLTLTSASTLTTRANDAATPRFVTTLAGGTIAANSYYDGDTTSLKHRVSKVREFDLDLTAVDPTFEKTIRAVSIILQGVYGTEGGLDNNANRVGEALFLIESALERTVSGTPPFGTELSGNLEQVQIDLAFDQILLKNTTEFNNKFIGFLDVSIADVENADPAEAIALLLEEQRALEASFQAFSRVRQLSLVNFI